MHVAEDVPTVDIELRWGAATHTGRVRSVNQDAVLAGPTIFAVADGMGGHAAGDVASSMAVAVLARAARFSEELDGASVVDAVRTANRAILDETERIGSTAGMGTTLALVAACGRAGVETILVLNIGDSRVYRYGSRDMDLEQLSTDHSVVSDLLAAGAIRPDEAATHPERNVITRALGVDIDPDVDTWEVVPVAGDRYLVCSDGLVRELSDAAIAAIVGARADAPTTAQQLLDAALDAGASDNVSVIVVDLVARAATRPARTPGLPADRPTDDTRPRGRA